MRQRACRSGHILTRLVPPHLVSPLELLFLHSQRRLLILFLRFIPLVTYLTFFLFLLLKRDFRPMDADVGISNIHDGKGNSSFLLDLREYVVLACGSCWTVVPCNQWRILINDRNLGNPELRRIWLSQTLCVSCIAVESVIRTFVVGIL